MAQIPFLADKEAPLAHLRDAEQVEIVEAIQRLETDRKFLEKNPASRKGEMTWKERKKKYDEFYETLAEVAEERFSQDEYLRILRMGME